MSPMCTTCLAHCMRLYFIILITHRYWCILEILCGPPVGISRIVTWTHRDSFDQLICNYFEIESTWLRIRREEYSGIKRGSESRKIRNILCEKWTRD
jgi:hypothetical protein